MTFQKRSISRQLTVALSLTICALWLVNDTSAQRPTRGKRDGATVKGRPDRKAIGPSNINILRKFREQRNFSKEGNEEFRTFNGTLNNLERPREGSIFTELIRMSPPAYSGFQNGIARPNATSARVISNVVSNQMTNTPSSRNLTDFAWQWGQFMDHDLDLTEMQLPPQSANIEIPMGDPIFDSLSQGGRVMRFNRSLHRVLPFRTNMVRQQLNEITAWVDASNVYGSEEERADELRTHVDGLMDTSGGGLFLPLSDANDREFFAGDIRSTEQVGLATMHTLFVREHNRIAAGIKADNPDLSDEIIYQRTRKEVYGILQAITYNEWLPALFGQELPAYEGYDPTQTPNIANEFSTAAFRFGHTMLNNQLMRLNDDGSTIDDGNILLRDAFFNRNVLLDYGVEPYLKGLATQLAQETDTLFISGVRNFLFANQPDADEGPSGPLGFDLAALNFHRGRDHGLPDYNTVRVAYGLPAMNSFAELTSNPLLQAQLATVYPTIDNVDPMVGMLAEDREEGSSFGETIRTIVLEQFDRVRNADRFWYEHIFTGDDLERIRNTTLADVIRRNTTLQNVQDAVFFSE